MPLQPDPEASSVNQAKRPGGEMKSSAAGAPSRSQLLPFGSEWQELMSKPYFMPGVIGALTLAVLFVLVGQPTISLNVLLFKTIPVDVPMYTVVLALVLTVGGAFCVYRMAGKPKAWWLMPVVGAVTAFLVYSPVMNGLQGFYRLGSSDTTDADSVIFTFFKMLLQAGLPEETLKCLPALAGLVIGMRFMRQLRNSQPARQLAVLEPLDGIILGTAAGFGFAFAETLFQYVPRTIVESGYTTKSLIDLFRGMGVVYTVKANTSTLSAVASLFQELVNKIGYERANFELQQILRARQSLGLELMIPRLFANIFGHSAYAGVMGYFIGLAAIRPVGRLKTILTGLAIAASLHALWDTIDSSVFLYFMVAFLAFAALAVCIIKARRLSPDQSQLVASQIIDRFNRSASSPVAGSAGAARNATAMPKAPPVPSTAARTASAAGSPGSITWDDGPMHRTIDIGGLRITAKLGAPLLEQYAPGSLASRGDAIIGEVNANPNDPSVLGIKNLSTSSWAVATPSGQERVVEPGRSIKLEAGMSIRIGTVVAHVR